MEYRVQTGHRYNSKLYIAGGNVYVTNKVGSDGALYLRCRHHHHCRGTAKLLSDASVVEEIRPHSCETTDDQTAYLPYLERMRELAATTQQDPKEIYNDVIGTAPLHVQANCLWPRCRPMLNAARRRIYDNNPINAGQAESILSGVTPFSSYYKGSVTFEDQLGLMFASTTLLALLSGITDVFVDATFRVVPSCFPNGQLLNILVDYIGTVIPVCHVLMTGRKEGLYTAAFEKLKGLVPDFNPTHGMADFEQAIKNSLEAVFENIDVRGCRFHFGQSIIKKLKSVGLQSDYLNTPAIKKWGKKYVALSCLPATLITGEVEKLQRETAAYPNRFAKKKMLKFEAYFLKYWMTQKTPAGFSTFGLRHRTNNSVESLHSQMQR